MREYTKLQSLQSEFSDFHKDFYGFRPRYSSNEQWNSEAYLEAQIKSIHDQMEAMKSTFQGREELREQGWVIEETDPEMIQWAAWLKSERDRFYAEQEAMFETRGAPKKVEPYEEYDFA